VEPVVDREDARRDRRHRAGGGRADLRLCELAERRLGVPEVGDADVAVGVERGHVHHGRVLLAVADVGRHRRDDRVVALGREPGHVDQHEDVRLLAGAEEQIVHRRGVRHGLGHLSLRERRAEAVAGEVVERGDRLPDVDHDDAVVGHAADVGDETWRSVVLPGDAEDLVRAVVLGGGAARNFERHEHGHVGKPPLIPLRRAIFLHFGRRGNAVG
jgi:hypothetical protein